MNQHPVECKYIYLCVFGCLLGWKTALVSMCWQTMWCGVGCMTHNVSIGIYWSPHCLCCSSNPQSCHQRRCLNKSNYVYYDNGHQTNRVHITSVNDEERPRIEHIRWIDLQTVKGDWHFRFRNVHFFESGSSTNRVFEINC